MSDWTRRELGMLVRSQEWIFRCPVFPRKRGEGYLSFNWTFRGVILAEFLGFVGGSPRVIEGVIESLVYSVFFNHVFFFSEVGDGWFFGEVKKTEVYFMFCDFQFPFEWLEWWPWLYYNTIHPVSVFVNTIDTASILGYNRPIYQPPLPAQWSY